MKESKTAILIFANSAEKEITSKSFSSKSLFETLNKQTINIAKKTGLPYFHFSEKQQIGNSFGERFTNAIQSVFDLGFNTVITIGNDTPHLTTKHILKTVEKLQKHSIVLGPSTDGGFYLMGLKKSQFNKETFLKLPWQTSKLNRSISKLKASKKINITYLEVLTDIDTASDIKLVLDSFKTLSKTLKTLLLQSFLSVKTIIFFHFISIKNFILNLQLNKGSPAFLHL
ncbi:DUF2064 domain-containing protein [Siansivirga zeaxanthinifaciens]|uniref:Glycosyltransferase n=1 Tax=Siansivirga zeaxanthinifaciens CC-SAMT-1 TaxID=1454006 RepID=A0A0C5WAX2_9FLAO|nr:DUF2064 domain-containing protein [Siansivirga zeaxanthinifaciens]AJR02529.1 hypothetical protein AW14_01555 [Siansivirga zeaxanthinifaciens CC-SAMT-1]